MKVIAALFALSVVCGAPAAAAESYDLLNVSESISLARDGRLPVAVYVEVGNESTMTFDHEGQTVIITETPCPKHFCLRFTVVSKEAVIMVADGDGDGVPDTGVDPNGVFVRANGEVMPERWQEHFDKAIALLYRYEDSRPRQHTDP